jgi:hypothetical protein
MRDSSKTNAAMFQINAAISLLSLCEEIAGITALAAAVDIAATWPGRLTPA